MSGEIPPELGNLTNLQGLYLDSNSLSGSIPPELGGLSSLRWLYINGNPLSGPLPLELSGLPLVLFHYYSTDICVPADESFRTWLNAISDHRGTGVDCASGAPDLLVSSVDPAEITLVAGGSRVRRIRRRQQLFERGRGDRGRRRDTADEQRRR